MHPAPHMTSEPRWVHLTTCGSGFEADVLRAELEAYDIPVLVHGPQAGFLGAGFQGPVIGGVEVLVPSPEIERATGILKTRIRPDDDE